MYLNSTPPFPYKIGMEKDILVCLMHQQVWLIIIKLSNQHITTYWD